MEKKPVQMCNCSFHMQKKGQFLEWVSCLFLWGCCCVSCFISCCSEGWYHEMQLNAAHSEGARANQRARFLPAASLGNRGPLFPKIRKTQSAAQPLPISDIWHMCSDCLVLQASFPCDCFLLNSEFVRSKLLGLFSQTENRIVVDPPPLLLPFPPDNKNGILNLPEDLRPPRMLLKATRGFPHGNFYTSWQVAETPGLRKTPNDDWERVRTTLKTCWVANIAVCRKAGSGIGGGQKRNRISGGLGASVFVKVSNGTREGRSCSCTLRRYVFACLLSLVASARCRSTVRACDSLSFHNTPPTTLRPLGSRSSSS